jgi:hypothetical protein
LQPLVASVAPLMRLLPQKHWTPKKCVSDVHLDQQHLGVATVFDARDGVVEAVTLVDAELYREVLVVWELVGEDATVRVVPDDVVSESEPCREMETYT